MNHNIPSATNNTDTINDDNSKRYAFQDDNANTLVLPNTVGIHCDQQQLDEQSQTIVTLTPLQQQQQLLQQQKQHSDVFENKGNSSRKETSATTVPGIDLSLSTMLQQQQQEDFVINNSTSASTATILLSSSINLSTNPIAITTTTTTMIDEQLMQRQSQQLQESNIPIHFDNNDNREKLVMTTSQNTQNTYVNESIIRANNVSSIGCNNDMNTNGSSIGNINNSNSTTKTVSFDCISKKDNSNRSSSSSSNSSNNDINNNKRRKKFVTNLSKTATVTKQHITQTPNHVMTVLQKQQSLEKSFRFFKNNPWFPDQYEYETIVVQKQQQQQDDDNNSDNIDDSYDYGANTDNNDNNNNHNNNRLYVQQETYKHKRSIRRRIFLAMTEPQSSIIGIIFFSILMIGIQVMNGILIAQSMRMHQYTPLSCSFCDEFEINNNTSTQVPIDIDCQCEPVPNEWTTVALRTIVNVLGVEILLRILLFTPPIQHSMKQSTYYQKVCYFTEHFKRFIFSARFIIDALAIFPYFSNSVDHVKGFVPLRFLQLFVVFQIVQLGRYNKAFQSFVIVLQKAFVHLKILLVILSFGALIFGSLIYWTERGTWQYYEYTNSFEYVRNSTNGDLGLSPYTSIPQSFWWFIVTATTVGYGDMYPVTGFGQFIASMAMIMGLLVIAYPVSVFSELWSIEMRRQGVITESNEIDNNSTDIDFNFNDNNEKDCSKDKHNPTTVVQSDKFLCTITKSDEQDTTDGKEVNSTLQQIKEEEEEIALVNDVQQQAPTTYNISSTNTDMSTSESLPSLSSPNTIEEKETSTNRRFDNALTRHQSSSTPVMRLVRSNSSKRSSGSTDTGGSTGTTTGGSSRRLLRWIDNNKSSKQINKPTDEEYGTSIVDDEVIVEEQQQPTRTTKDYTLLQLDKNYIALEKEDLTTLLIEMQMITESQRRIHSILKKYKLS